MASLRSNLRALFIVGTETSSGSGKKNKTAVEAKNAIVEGVRKALQNDSLESRKYPHPSHGRSFVVSPL